MVDDDHDIATILADFLADAGDQVRLVFSSNEQRRSDAPLLVFVP